MYLGFKNIYNTYLFNYDLHNSKSMIEVINFDTLLTICTYSIVIFNMDIINKNMMMKFIW